MIRLIVEYVLTVVVLGVVAFINFKTNDLSSTTLKITLFVSIVIILISSLVLNTYDYKARLSQTKSENETQNKLSDIQEKVELIYQSTEIQKYKWNEVKVMASPISKYILLLFESSPGIMKGHVRIKDSKETYPFSTEVNNSVPVAIPNILLSDGKQYQSNPIIEYEITQTGDEKNSLRILLKGFILNI